jgi:hypothetical protein
MEDAYNIMQTIKKHAEAKDIKDMDLKYMTYFIKERLHRLEKIQDSKDKNSDNK